MLGYRDGFSYLECGSCGCVQLLTPPADLGRYYPFDYDAFRKPDRAGVVVQSIKQYLRRQRNLGYFKTRNVLGWLLTRRYEHLRLKAFARIRAGREARILDVGCGSGSLLLDLKELGYRNLLGVDLFIPQQIDYGNGVRVVKGELRNLSGTRWDVIMFHHSFEHIRDPAETLRITADLLAAGGCCLIRLPLASWAWQHYGVNWVQLDAPRHLFLHTEKSLQLLAEAARMKVERIEYDSTEFQYWGSELYARDIAQSETDKGKVQSLFPAAELRRLRQQAQQLNLEGRGDQAAFYVTGPLG